MSTATLHPALTGILDKLSLSDHPSILPPDAAGATAVSMNPADGAPLAAVKLQSTSDYEDVVRRSQLVQREWRMLPAPKRGELVRRMGNAFREHLEPLGELVTLEMGKIRPEGMGEIQECVDIADFAVGLSRQLHGLTMHSEIYHGVAAATHGRSGSAKSCCSRRVSRPFASRTNGL